MRSMKLTAVALVLAIAGAVQAVAWAQVSAQAGAGEKPSCCKMHKMGGEHTSSADTCNMKDGGCCDCFKAHAQKSSAHHSGNGARDCCAGGCCNMNHRAGASQSSADANGAAQADSCPADGCCDGSEHCKAHHAAKSSSAASNDRAAQHDCCGSCCKAHVAKR